LVIFMFNKLAFVAYIFGAALWCGAAASGHATDAPAPAVAVTAMPRRVVGAG